MDIFFLKLLDLCHAQKTPRFYRNPPQKLLKIPFVLKLIAFNPNTEKEK